MGMGAGDHHTPMAAGMYSGGGVQYVLDGGAGSHQGLYAAGVADAQTHYDYNQVTSGGGVYSAVGPGYHYIGGAGGGQEMMAQISVTPGSGAIAGLTPTSSSASSHHTQVVHHGGGHAFYIDDGTVKTDVMDGSVLSTATRASPATVQWLLDNYETCEGTSLPRSTLYTHYLQHCHDYKHEPMNPASFGKLIRSVFLGLRTRRLGTRGNSKYHYYGIRVKATSNLHHTLTEEMGVAARQAISLPKRSLKVGSAANGDDMSRPQDRQSSDSGACTVSPAANIAAASASSSQPEQQQYQDCLGSSPENALLSIVFEVPLSHPLPDGIGMEHVHLFERLYKEHCKTILDAIMNVKFPTIEILWQQFWRLAPVAASDQQNGTTAAEAERQLEPSRLVTLCSWAPTLDFLQRCDYAFYQVLVSVLMPDVLRPIPSALTQMIRNFAKNLEGWLTSAMYGLPDEVIRTKVGSVAALSQMLRRYTSLNHLAQAARAVLQNPVHLEQMLADLNRVDFTNVQEQASWVCQCDDAMVTQLQQDFKQCLQQQHTLEEWADWLEEVVVDVLKLHDVSSGSSGASSDLPRVARLFLLKWSFYSSMVIRDLTLRSAASFGSFHLIRLLFDEYMFYIVEHRVAEAVGDTPISIMAKLNDLGNGNGLLASLANGIRATGAPSPPSTPPPASLNGAGATSALGIANGSSSQPGQASTMAVAASRAGAATFGTSTAGALKPSVTAEMLAKKVKYV